MPLQTVLPRLSSRPPERRGQHRRDPAVRTVPQGGADVRVLISLCS